MPSEGRELPTHSDGVTGAPLHTGDPAVQVCRGHTILEYLIATSLCVRDAKLSAWLSMMLLGVQNNAAESADLARLLFSMTEDSSDKGGLKPSPSMKVWRHPTFSHEL